MRTRLIAVMFAVLIAAAAPARADENETEPAAPSDAPADQRIAYPAPDDGGISSITAADVGDVNGDGLDDFAAAGDLGHGYVTFSRREGGTIDAETGGFTVDSPWAWYGVAGAGDVNGDGLGDIAIELYDRVVVVFGKRGHAPVDTGDLGQDGFTIAGAWPSPASGQSVRLNVGISAPGDLNGDGIPDLVFGTGDGAAVVYPPRDAAGTTINASAPGPSVARLTTSGDDELDASVVGDLGDHTLLVGGRHRTGGSAAYGVAAPAPGETVDLSDAVAERRAFRLWAPAVPYGMGDEFASALTLGDQNGDGRRDVGLLARYGQRLVVVYAPAFGTATDISDFGAADARGYAMNGDGNVTDVGDQNGDGRSDLGLWNNVYFTDPARENGERDRWSSGFYFWSGAIVGPVADLNGDGRPELATADQDASGFHVDVFDSVKAPRLDDPGRVSVYENALAMPVGLVTGAGDRRGHGGVTLLPKIELERPTGVSEVADAYFYGTPNVDQATANLDLSTWFPEPFVAGQTYRARVTVSNGRGGRTTGPWRSFTPTQQEIWGESPDYPADGGQWSWPESPLPPPPTPPWLAPTWSSTPSAPHPHRPPRQPHVPLATVLHGTAKSDHVKGTGIAERMFGLGGNDTIDGAGGNDFIDGGSGNDKLIGGAGDDQLIGGGGTDKFSAGPGNDWINANDGKREVVDCGAGKDTAMVDTKDRVVHCEKVRRNR